MIHFLNVISMIIIMSKITVITSSRDREEFLEDNIDHISKINSLKEQIIIDFDSFKKIQKSKYKNTKVKILNVVQEPEWSITRSYNVGINFAKTEYIMKVDADILIDYEKFNKINFENYDILYFMENDWDPGNFICKASLLKDVNGFNEYIKSRFDDNDMLKRIENKGYKVDKVSGLIKEKKSHSDELRHKTTNNYFKNKSNDIYSYAVVKAHNDAGAYISSLNIWGKKNKLDYQQLSNLDIKILHPKYYERVNVYFKLKLKFIYLRTFFTIFYKDRNSIVFSIIKRLLPILMIFIPKLIIQTLIGVKPSS